MLEIYFIFYSTAFFSNVLLLQSLDEFIVRLTRQNKKPSQEGFFRVEVYSWEKYLLKAVLKKFIVKIGLHVQ